MNPDNFYLKDVSGLKWTLTHQANILYLPCVDPNILYLPCVDPNILQANILYLPCVDPNRQKKHRKDSCEVGFLSLRGRGDKN